MASSYEHTRPNRSSGKIKDSRVLSLRSNPADEPQNALVISNSSLVGLLRIICAIVIQL